MELRLKVTPWDGEPYEVDIALAEMAAWERKYKSKVSDLAKGIGLEDMAFMAYKATEREGKTIPAVFDDFLFKKVRKVEVVEQAETRPTPGAPTDGD